MKGSIHNIAASIYHQFPYRIRRRISERKEFKVFPWAKKELQSNKQFRNICLGKRCFIIGNGPSLASLDFASLANEYTFTFNQITRNPDFDKLRTNFHFWSDDRFFHLDTTRPEDMELLNIMKKVNSEKNHPVVFYTLKAYEMIKQYKLDELLDIHYFSNGGAAVNNNVKHELSPDHPYQGLSTTVHYAICFAVYMGFKKIYLLGCDCSGFMSVANAKLNMAEKALYAYNISENEKRRMERVARQTTMKQELISAVDVFEKYEFMKRYCDAREVELYNATEGGLLDSVPQVDIKDVLYGNG